MGMGLRIGNVDGMGWDRMEWDGMRSTISSKCKQITIAYVNTRVALILRNRAYD